MSVFLQYVEGWTEWMCLTHLFHIAFKDVVITSMHGAYVNVQMKYFINKSILSLVSCFCVVKSICFQAFLVIIIVFYSFQRKIVFSTRFKMLIEGRISIMSK